VYGSYDLGELSIKNEYFRIEIERRGEWFFYTRESENEKKERVLGAERGKIIVTPVEPVNLPKEITNYMEIKLKSPIVIGPGDSKVVYLKFPVEIGVFIAWRRASEVLDIIGLNKPKYTLYGEPKNGVICRYSESEVYRSLPNSNPLKESVMRLRIMNGSGEWIEVNNIVFDVFGMKMYYDDFLVFCDAEMKCISKKVAETQFYDSPLRKGMKKALELYVARRIIMPKGKFTMEWGL
jgi:hypothetical protein